jgi:hypothetical protein
VDANAAAAGTLADRADAADLARDALAARAEALESTTAAHTGRLDAADLARDALRVDIDANAAALQTHDGLLAGLRTDTNNLDLAWGATDAALAAFAVSMDQELEAIDTALGALDSSVGDLGVDLVALDASVVALDEAVDENAADIAEAMAQATTPRRIQRHVSQGNDPRDSGWLSGRSLTFTKEHGDTAIRLTWSDNRRGIGYIWGYWEAYVDGQPCTSPAPMRWWHHSYTTASSNHNDNHYSAAIVGYCSATSAGPIGPGEHTVAIHLTHQGGNNSDWYVGWNNTTFVMEVEEVY